MRKKKGFQILQKIKTENKKINKKTEKKKEKNQKIYKF